MKEQFPQLRTWEQFLRSGGFPFEQLVQGQRVPVKEQGEQPEQGKEPVPGKAQPSGPEKLQPGAETQAQKGMAEKVT